MLASTSDVLPVSSEDTKSGVSESCEGWLPEIEAGIRAAWALVDNLKQNSQQE